MFKAKTKKTLKELAPMALVATVLAIIALFLCVGPGCVSPDAVKTEIQGVRNDMGKLEKVVEQKAEITTIAETIEHFKQEVNQNLLAMSKTINNSGTIKYGGGGWIVVGTSLIAIIFVGAGLLLVRAFMKRGDMLTLLTGTIKNAGKNSPEIAQIIKKQLKIDTSNGGPFTERHRKSLGNFTKKVGTFMEQKVDSEV